MITPKSLAIRALLFFLSIGLLGHGAHAQSPSEPGPLAVSSKEYNLVLDFFRPTGFSVDVGIRGIVHYPAGLLGGPFPLVVLMHGNSSGPCFDNSGAATTGWPCPQGSYPVKSYLGFNYVASVLASYGYIVVSIDADGVIGHGAEAWVELLQHHINLWNTFNSGVGYFDSLFADKVDMNNIGTMGHSFGGEAVATHAYNNGSNPPNGLRAAFLLAPKNYNRLLIDKVNLGVLLPYCDGDLEGLPGVHYYDDARYSSAADAFAKHTFLVMGANHNYYNTVWTPGYANSYSYAADDWQSISPAANDPHCGRGSQSERLSPAQQQATGISLIVAFFRTYLGHEKQFMSMLRGDTVLPSIHASYHPPAANGNRLDINRLDSEARTATNTLNGDVDQSDGLISNICGDVESRASCLVQYKTPNCYELDGDEVCPPPYEIAWIRQPHTAKFDQKDKNKLGLSQLLLTWNTNSEWYENLLYDKNQQTEHYRNIQAYDVLQFRVGLVFDAGQPQNFSVQLRDGTGAVASTRIGDYSDALFHPPGDPSLDYSKYPLIYGGNVVPKLFLNTVRIPLSKFTGVNLSKIVAVRFVFDQTSQGAVSVSDIALAKDERLRALKIISLIPLLTAE